MLTADAFGAILYLPPHILALPFLGRARALPGDFTLRDWLSAHGVEIDLLDECDIAFWPGLASHEPDALVLLGHQGQPRVAVLVEAKLHSPQHLIKEFSQLGYYAIQHGIGAYDDPDLALPRLRPVIFLTERPEALPEIEKARDELRGASADSGRWGDGDLEIFWTT